MTIWLTGWTQDRWYARGWFPLAQVTEPSLDYLIVGMPGSKEVAAGALAFTQAGGVTYVHDRTGVSVLPATATLDAAHSVAFGAILEASAGAITAKTKPEGGLAAILTAGDAESTRATAQNASESNSGALTETKTDA